MPWRILLVGKGESLHRAASDVTHSTVRSLSGNLHQLTIDRGRDG